MKKLTAILLTGCLTFQMLSGSVVSVRGADFTSGPSYETLIPQAPSSSEELPAEEFLSDDLEDSLDFSAPEEEEAVFEDGDREMLLSSNASVGGIDVAITSTLPFSSNASVEVTVNGPTGSTKYVTLQGNQASYRGDAFFEGLPKGSYVLTIRTSRFAAYHQTIEVREGYTSKVQIHSSKIQGYGEKHPGVLLLGDVTGDYQVNDSDKNAMVTALHNNSPESVYDLNGDQMVNLADLQYLAHSLTESPVESSVETLIYTKAVESTVPESTHVKGSLEQLLTNQGSVELTPSNNGAITEQNPVEASFDFSQTAGDENGSLMAGLTIQAPVTVNEGEAITSDIKSGRVEVQYIDPDTQEEITASYSLGNEAASVSMFRTGGSVTVGADGTLTLDFGKQIAVKKVTIKITGTRKNEAFVNISKVEFVNDMASRIPAPQLGIPSQLSASVRSKQIDLSWKQEPNVTGYELSISGLVGKKGSSEAATQIVGTSATSHTFTTIKDKNLINNEIYTIKIRSVNGDWRSEWSEEIRIAPKAEEKPAAPDNLKALGGYRSIQLNWKDMDDTDSYNLYYKGPEMSSFVKVNETPLTAPSYNMVELKDNTTYQFYVTGVNELGEGPASLTSEATTIVPEFPKVPKYQLLNTSNGEGNVTDHIQEAVIGSNGAHMIESPLDTEKRSGLGLFDDSYSSYWTVSDWDDGVAYPPSDSSKGITITLDDTYKMNYLSFGAADKSFLFGNARFWYWNSQNQRTEVSCRLIQKTDENDNHYYILKLNEAIETNKVQFCLQTQSNVRKMKIAEIHFHQYDSLEDEIMGLYEDEMHITLKEQVTLETIEELRTRVNTIDEASQEYHPLREELIKELDVAKGILENKKEKAYAVNPNITAQKDGHLKFSGLNSWQPLGKTTYSGERLTIYVGHNTLKSGQSAQLQLVFTQNHAESSGFFRTWNLNVGKNELTVPSLQSIAGVEKGGQLYISYTGNNPEDQYGVRIVGGQNIPSLNLIGLSPEERETAIQTYVEELKTHVEQLTQKHTDFHESINNKNINVAYDKRNCVLNATDILVDQMMYSVPATQIWKGLSGSDVSQKAASLKTALDAMEKAMILAYQHKGISDVEGTPAKDRLPSQHLNIRYMRMFAGAFMYASGNHVGIEFDQTSILARVNDMADLGWGIAHEIGHNINEPSYTVAEITNNYFAQLITLKKNGLRFQMPKVYEKVTSGTVGRSSNLATQLALYWQLHLAFDNGADDTTYSSYDQLLNNLFFARMDSYSRDTSRAPKSGLKTDGDADQNLMRLACAAANQNLLPFFQRWGMIPDETTKAYAEQYGEPTAKAYYYVSPEARNYRVSHEETSYTIAGQDVASASIAKNQNQITLTMDATQKADAIHGYEILRSITGNGREETQVVGFVESQADGSATYTDTVTSLNNRVITYLVRPVDKFMNYGNTTTAGSAKIETEGRLDKSDWKVSTTNIKASNNETLLPDENNSSDSFCSTGEKVKYAIDYILDNQAGTAFEGSASVNGHLTIDMGKVQEITSLQYTGSSLSDISIAVSADGSSWKSVKAHVSVNSASEERHTIWFDSVDPDAKAEWIGTYDARYVALVFHQKQNVSISEIELCGPSGDNLEFYQTGEETPAVGILEEDFTYGNDKDHVIPKGSLIFTGTYKGNPAYNVVMLYDQQGNVIGIQEDAEGNATVEAEQVIFADVPKYGNLGETSNGTWVYYIKPDASGEISSETKAQLKGAIRGELYRVDNALTNEGERVVSDTLPLTVDSENLPTIKLTSSGYVVEP